MSHAIHKIVSIKRCQSYFIDGCRRIKIERNNLLCEQAPTEVFRSIFAWLVARLTFHLFQLPDISVVLCNSSVGGEESGLGDVH